MPPRTLLIELELLELCAGDTACPPMAMSPPIVIDAGFAPVGVPTAEPRVLEPRDDAPLSELRAEEGREE